MKTIALLAAVATLTGTAAAAAPIAWTDWTSATPTLASGTVAGTTVTIDGPFDYVSTSGGYDFWHNPAGSSTPWAAYAALPNTPTNTDVISPTGNRVTHTITFGHAVTNPYVAIISLGQYSVPTTWDFSVPFTLVGQGQGYWGNGTFTITGNRISAGEGHGAIQLQGTFSSFTLLTDTTENWSGLTFGVGAVPEPATWALMVGGLALVGVAGRRRARTTVAA